MPLTLIHNKFKALLDSLTSKSAHPVFIPIHVELPAYMYEMTSITRDIESNLKDTTISAHVFNVYVAAKSFSECQTLTQDLITGLDQYKDLNEGFLLTLVEDGADGYDNDLECFTKSLVISVRVKEE